MSSNITPLNLKGIKGIYDLSIKHDASGSGGLVFTVVNNESFIDFSQHRTDFKCHDFTKLEDTYAMLANVIRESPDSITFENHNVGAPNETLLLVITVQKPYTNQTQRIYEVTLTKSARTKESHIIERVHKLEQELKAKEFAIQKLLSKAHFAIDNKLVKGHVFKSIDAHHIGTSTIDKEKLVCTGILPSSKVFVPLIENNDVQHMRFKITGSVLCLCGTRCILEGKHSCPHMHFYGSIGIGYCASYKKNDSDVNECIEHCVLPCIAEIGKHAVIDGELKIVVDRIVDVYVNLREQKCAISNNDVMEYTQFKKTYKHIPTFASYPPGKIDIVLKMQQSFIKGDIVTQVTSSGDKTEVNSFNNYAETGYMVTINCVEGLTFELV